MRKQTASRTAKLVINWLHFQLNSPAMADLVDPVWRQLTATCIRQLGTRGKLWDYVVKNHRTHQLYHQWVPEAYQAFAKHLLFRKLWVERQVRAFCQQHHEAQVVIVGAGLDTLATRLAPRMPKTNFYEVDHPATQALKLRLLKTLPAPLDDYRAPPNLQWVTADLTSTKLSQVLPATELPILFVMEGLLMYLPESIVAALFDSLREISPTATAAFTFLSPWQTEALPLALGHLATFWLKLWGEPFEWVLPNTTLKQRMTEWGWTVKELGTSAEEASTVYRNAFDIDVAEHFCLAKSVSRRHTPQKCSHENDTKPEPASKNAHRSLDLLL